MKYEIIDDGDGWFYARGKDGWCVLGTHKQSAKACKEALEAKLGRIERIVDTVRIDHAGCD